jgi:hypothetical protein
MARARKFLAFRIQLNETNVVTAGIPGPHVVSTIISSVVREPGRTTPSGRPMLERELELEVGGLVTVDEQHVSWVRAALKVGDRITVDVIETSTVDEPARRAPRIPSKKTAAPKASGPTPTAALTRKPKRIAQPKSADRSRPRR